MRFQIELYTPPHEPAVRAFNSRLQNGGARTDFYAPGTAPEPQLAPVKRETYLALEQGIVRGSILIQTTPAWLRGREILLMSTQSPLSEGLIDPQYAVIAGLLHRHALTMSPFAYGIGMGYAENQIARLLRAMGWTFEPVPFYFRMLRPSACLRQLGPLRRSPARRIAATLAALTGTGALALAWAQRRRENIPVGKYAFLESWQLGADEAWNDFRNRCSFALRRDLYSLPSLYGSVGQRVECGSLGWGGLVISRFRNNSYFGNLTVAILADVVPRAGCGPALVRALTAAAEARGAGLIVGNFLHSEVGAALQTNGFLSYASNFYFSASRALAKELSAGTVYISRRDGDGLVNLISGS